MHLTQVPNRGHSSLSYELLVGFLNISIKDSETIIKYYIAISKINIYCILINSGFIQTQKQFPFEIIVCNVL